MVTPTFDIRGYPDRHTQPRLGTQGECLRHRLEIVATSVIDVVAAAGGWVCDRALAGWQVTVLLPPGCDTRPVRILGASTAEMPAGLALPGRTSPTLAVSASAFAADDHVRQRVLESLDHRLAEVALWGDGWPLRVSRGTRPVHHVLSAAARAFKRQALAAAGTPHVSIDYVEALLGDTMWTG
ncbi:hypothetical protein MB901379_00310 [Mycobacterium basiliense]|uniref:Uncharacterized protein n=1 Tax=Mycobacterium basiliense TaxID=2094119 RepID=A0A447G8H7_9MYCO|nr:hypothetical protein [Mycobacterium basiliense]VDM86785.1 hypothetical protein MB901379_00310 [Mycobacterium basiliense]